MRMGWTVNHGVEAFRVVLTITSAVLLGRAVTILYRNYRVFEEVYDRAFSNRERPLKMDFYFHLQLASPFTLLRYWRRAATDNSLPAPLATAGRAAAEYVQQNRRANWPRRWAIIAILIILVSHLIYPR